jgi:hypothetical protein
MMNEWMNEWLQTWWEKSEVLYINFSVKYAHKKTANSYSPFLSLSLSLSPPPLPRGTQLKRSVTIASPHAICKQR